jgi:hypothetical protein
MHCTKGGAKEPGTKGLSARSLLFVDYFSAGIFDHGYAARLHIAGIDATHGLPRLGVVND